MVTSLMSQFLKDLLVDPDVAVAVEPDEHRNDAEYEQFHIFILSITPPPFAYCYR